MNEADAILDDLLSRWHAWQRAQRMTEGFNRKALVVGDYLISRQHDDTNGKLDDDLEAMRSRQVDHEVREMGEPHRTAIYLDARNISCGIAVWNSPRLPDNPEERAIVVRFARLVLTKRLISAGVM